MESASRDFQALTEEFYEVWFRFHPDALLRAGLPGYTGNMPAVDDNTVGALGSWLESTIVGLEEIDFHALDSAGQIDMELLFGACRDEYQAILERDWRHRDPLAFIPLRTICLLALGAGSNGHAALGVCLEGVPEFLRQARSRLLEYPKLIPRIWIEAALSKGEATVSFLRWLGDRDDAAPGLQTLCNQVSQAVADYLRFLRDEITPDAQGTAACGWQRFQEQLRLRHHLSDKLGDHLDMARQTYQKTLTELGMLSLEQSGSDDPRAWLEKLRRRGPLQADERLPYVRRRCSEIHRLLADSGEFDLPVPGGVELRLMPEEYPVDWAADYRPPAPAPGVDGSTGILYLAPADGGADTPEQLTAWCIRNAWPGRHLQAVTAAASPLSNTLVRRLNLAPSQQIGWSLYAEQLMQELGLFPAPEQLLQCLLERLRRSLMALLDIEIHVHGMAASGALLQLQALPGNSAEGAARDLLDLTRHPTQHLAAVVNWRLFDALRRWQASSGEGDLSDFHARLLAQGSVASPPIIRKIFGQKAWDWVETQI